MPAAADRPLSRLARRSRFRARRRNYAAHIKELNNATPTEPFFFLKPPSSIIADGEDVECPKSVTLHHEGESVPAHSRLRSECAKADARLDGDVVELGVVIGKPGRNILAKDADSYIAGYTLAIDYTGAPSSACTACDQHADRSATSRPAHPATLAPAPGRNMQDAVKKKGLPWSSAKGMDTWCPVSTPSFIPASSLPSPGTAHLTYSVNGETRQSGSTALMLYPIPALIAHVSSIMRLEEGDLILTGTPEGVSRVVEGDRVEASLKDESGKVLATLKHKIVAREGGYEFKG